jgi:hypothetical protein
VFSPESPIFSREFVPKAKPQQIISQTIRSLGIASDR